MYNLVKRQAEVEILPMALSEGLGVIPYSPLGGGLLTGKYAPGQRPERSPGGKSHVPGALRWGSGCSKRPSLQRSWPDSAVIEPAGLAVAWVGSHPAVTAPIIGARNLEQLEGSLKSVDVPMTPELRAEISALSPEPPLATDRSEESSASR